MSRIEWDRLEDRKFEAGVEKGVLYVGNKAGVAWNGLVSVEDNYTENQVEARYQSGVKTYNHVPLQEYETTITAFTYPNEFEECLGLYEVSDGIFTDEQDRVPFGLTYQTRVGDAAKKDFHAFRIHLIYNAIATPNQLLRSTIGDIPELTAFSWGLKTTPAEAPGFRPSSHFVLDPNKMGPRMYQYIYDRLYGAPGIMPRLLYPKDIIGIVDDWRILYPSSGTYPSLDTFPGGP